MKDICHFLCYHDVNQLRDVDTNKYICINGRTDELNDFFSEFSVYKTIYNTYKDNINNLPEYISFNHYRRQFSKPDEYYLNLLSPDKVICYEKITDYNNTGAFGIKEWSGDDWFGCDILYNEFINYVHISNKPKYIDVDYTIRKKRIMYSHSCFIMHKTKFFELCKFIIGFFNYISKKYKLSDYDDFIEFIDDIYVDKHKNGFRLPFGFKFKSKEMYRVFSFCGEWLVSMYVTCNFKESNIIAENEIKG